MIASVRIGLVMLVAVAALPRPSEAATYVVGDSLGWLVPPGGPIAYETWAARHSFKVGDILVFNFTTGEQDVARVTKEAFDACNSTNPIFLETTGPYNYTLSAPDEYYFIGTMDRHCYLGQKLAINVSATGSSPSPPSSPSPSSPSVPPSRGSITYVVGDNLGWIVPPGGKIAYETWAYGKIFHVGDKLEFNFTTGEQDVARVTKEAFDACNSTNPIFLETTGPYNYTLDAPGEYYFIGTMDRHCYLGQKLAINVSSTGSSPSPPSSPSPSSPSVPPSRGSITYVVGDNLGWIVPPGGKIAYETWAYGKAFFVGDKLVFNFENGTQDVVEVTKDSFDSCNTSSPISVLTVSPAVVTLVNAGEHFYTSSYSRHCALGQKLAINVTSSGTGPTPSPSSIANPPSSNPSSSETSPTAGGPSSTVPQSAAPARATLGLGFGTAMMGLALGLVH